MADHYAARPVRAMAERRGHRPAGRAGLHQPRAMARIGWCRAATGGWSRASAPGCRSGSPARSPRCGAAATMSSSSPPRGTLRAGQVILTVPLGVLAAERIGFDPIPARAGAGGPGRPAHGQSDQGRHRLCRRPVRPRRIPSMSPPRRAASGRSSGSPGRSAAISHGVCRRQPRPGNRRHAAGRRQRRGHGAAGRDAGRWCPRADRHLPSQRLAPRSLGAGQLRHGAAREAAARAALRQPWSERVHYAGEAAAADGWHGTVAGAYLSGRAAARAMIAEIGNCRPPVTME